MDRARNDRMNALEAAKAVAEEFGPNLDRIIDKMLTDRDAKDGHPDPLDPGKFPSLGFENEERGSYFIQIKRGKLMVTVWRIIATAGAPESFNIHTYTWKEFHGVGSWGGVANDRLTTDSLLHVQALVHGIFTSEGNSDGVEG